MLSPDAASIVAARSFPLDHLVENEVATGVAQRESYRLFRWATASGRFEDRAPTVSNLNDGTSPLADSRTSRRSGKADVRLFTL
jgi:hypothetical protein